MSDVDVLHMVKLAVGVRDVGQLSAPADGRRVGPPTFIRTRMMPKRAVEIIDGGSLYWIIANAFAARQRILDIAADTYGDGTRCARIVLQPELALVTPRHMRPFQGWRYLRHDSVPADDASGAWTEGAQEMPVAMRRELMGLCLL